MDNKNISVLHFNQVEMPMPKENPNSRNEWIQFGVENNYPLYLINLSHRSALHNAILTSKTESICGKGVNYLKTNGDDPNTELFITSPNPNETLDEIIRKFSWDLELFGGYYINVIWSKDKKSIAEIYHVEFDKVRSGKTNEKQQVTEFFYSDDWTQARKYNFKPVPIKAFNTCLLYTSPSPRDRTRSRMPSSA